MPTLPNPSTRLPRRRVDGVLLLDKPVGLSSNAALQRAKRLYNAEKAGHTGTLDPLASGLLPLCFGDATKFAQALLDSDKEYLATIEMGAATTTGDAEGEVVAHGRSDFSSADIDAVLPRFIGAIAQIPPRHSALKYRGRNYYDYARAGIEIPRAAREVEVRTLELVEWSAPRAIIRVACGKGTYVRVLAEDIGVALGSHAHLAALRRTMTGPFTIDAASSLERLEPMDAPGRDALLLPIDAPLSRMRRLDVDPGAANALRQGRLASVAPQEAGRYRCYAPGAEFLGIVDASAGELRAVRLARTDGAAA